MANRLRVLSGIQPSHESFHFGNYLGALRNWVSFQDDHDAFYCIVDLHALTSAPEPDALRQRSRAAAAQLLALGLDPARCTLFVQSHVPEHAELAWVLNCLTGFGEASRMTQFKDRSARLGADRVNVGIFTYPVLMAGDILLYQADRVPVGEDQRQHLELTRDLAQRFNARYGETFTVPEGVVPKDTPKITDLQEPTAKMSKTAESQSGLLELLEDPASLRKKVKSAVTDSGRDVVADPADKPGITNLLTIYSALSGRSVDELEAAYAGKGYGDFKADLAELVADFVAPIQKRYREYADDAAALDKVLAEGAERARKVAVQTMGVVRERVGFLPARA